MSNEQKKIIKAIYVGDPHATVLEPTPPGTAIEVLKELPQDRYQVRTLPGQGKLIQTWEVFEGEFFVP